MTVLEYLRKLFRNDPDLSQYDISEGSNYYDLVYKTLEIVLNSSLMRDVAGWGDIYDINNLDKLSYEDIAHIAAQYGIPAPWTNFSYGNVRLIFNTPITVELPLGTVFSSNAGAFATMSYESILSKYLESNTKTSDGKYQSQPIAVYSPSGQYAKANSLGLVNLSILELARIENDEINNGTAGADKEVLASMIRATVRGIATGTEESVDALMRYLCPDVTAVEVVTGDDELMTRDLMVNAYIYGAPAMNQQSFHNKIYGNNVTNKNIAYRGTLYDAEPPDIDSLYGKTELSQYQYINLGNEDAAPLVVTTDNEFVDSFASYNNFGATCALDYGVTNGDNFFYAHGAYWIDPGSSVNLEGYDIDDILHKTQVIIRDAVARNHDIVSIGVDGVTYTVTLAADAADIIGRLRPGQIIDLNWVRLVGEAEFDLTVTVDAVDTGTLSFTFISADPVLTGTCEAEYPGNAMWSEYQIVGLFNLDLTAVTASMPDDISIQIGGGWIVSEHGYPVGMKVSDKEVYVENEVLVMGGETGSIQDPLRDVVVKGGLGRFTAAVLRAMSVKRPNSGVQPIPVVNTDEMER